MDVESAFDKIKPNKSKDVPILYRKDRYEKEWHDGLGDGVHPEHPDKADHLGGSWFKGMAEEIEHGKGRGLGNFLNFDKMIGRDDGDDGVEERLLLEEALNLGVDRGDLPRGNNSKGGRGNRDGQHALDLHPNWEILHLKENKVDIRMKDPEAYPRFKDDLKVNSQYLHIIYIYIYYYYCHYYYLTESPLNYLICLKQ